MIIRRPNGRHRLGITGGRRVRIERPTPANIRWDDRQENGAVAVAETADSYDAHDPITGAVETPPLGWQAQPIRSADDTLNELLPRLAATDQWDVMVEHASAAKREGWRYLVQIDMATGEIETILRRG